MLYYVIGNIVEADVDIVVNAANGIGWMGGYLTSHWKFSGVAETINFVTKGKVEREIRSNYKIYLPGKAFFTNGYGVGKIGIIHGVTMLLPGCFAREKTVWKLLSEITKLAEIMKARTIAMPFLGCGVGRLKKERVKEIYESFFGETSTSFDVYVYDLK